jgi:hypothetical protein
MGRPKVPGKGICPKGNVMSEDTPTHQTPAKPLTPAAERALAEAKARRAEIDRKAAEGSGEQGGRGGLDPARYGDWEIKGLTADF